MTFVATPESALREANLLRMKIRNGHGTSADVERLYELERWAEQAAQPKTLIPDNQSRSDSWAT